MSNQFQSMMDALAFVIGGTASLTEPKFYSGTQAGDGTGLQPGTPAFAGCYSAPPPIVNTTPLGIVLPGRATSNIPIGGIEERENVLELLILIMPNDSQSQVPNLAWYADGVPDLLSQHMQLKDSTGTPLNNSGWVSWPEFQFGVVPWGGTDYLAYRFHIRIPRVITRSYVA